MGGDDDYDSRLVPTPSVFYELYRPWTANESNQLHPRELGATNADNGIDLLQVTDDDSPVWRMVIGGSTSLPQDPSFNSMNLDVTPRPGYDVVPETDQLRRVYFTRPPVGVGEVESDLTVQDKVYFPSDTVQGLLAGNTLLQPGEFAVIGSSGTINGGAYDTWLGRRATGSWDTELDQTRGFTLFPGTGEIEVREGNDGLDVFTREVIAIPIDQTKDVAGTEITRSLGVSDPRAGYYDYVGLSDVTPVADGFAFISTQDEPADPDSTGFRFVGNEVKTTFSSVFLQRLANPTEDYHSVTNPYVTVDRHATDLTIFNGVVANDSDDPAIGTPASNPNRTLTSFASNERGRITNPDLVSSAAAIPLNLRRRLWPVEGPTEVGVMMPRLAEDPMDDNHFFRSLPYTSMGTFNKSHTHIEFSPVPPAASVAPVGFAHLQWNNRPFANRFELMDVPYTDSFALLASQEISSVAGYSLEKIATKPCRYPSSGQPIRSTRSWWLARTLAELLFNQPGRRP